MCGICGVAGGEPSESQELVGRMCDAMVHRGPDDEGGIQLDGVTLGSRRLSIIDIAGGHQPIHNEDSTVWVIQNGEIYNHLELRKLLEAAGHEFTTQSDTEVLAHGYEEWWLGSGIHRLHRYWSPTLEEENGSRGRSLDEECEELRVVLRESVRKELISDVPLGVFLSGGIDSSAVTAMMSQLGTDVKSFSVGFAEPSFDEASHAREVARHLGTEHHEL